MMKLFITIAVTILYGVVAMGQVTVIENGNVGVGEVAPSEKLEVVGAVKSTTRVISPIFESPNDFGIRLGASPNAPYWGYTFSVDPLQVDGGWARSFGAAFLGDSKLATIGAHGNKTGFNFLYFNTTPYIPTDDPDDFKDWKTTDMILRPYPDGARLGLGTQEPSERLDVVGNIEVSGAYVDSDGHSGDAMDVLMSTSSGTQWSPLPGSNFSNDYNDIEIGEMTFFSTELNGPPVSRSIGVSFPHDIYNYATQLAGRNGRFFFRSQENTVFTEWEEVITGKKVSKWNDVEDAKFSLISSASDGPPVGVSMGANFPHATAGYATQIAGRNDRFFLRSQDQDIWKPWREIYTTRTPNIINNWTVLANGDITYGNTLGRITQGAKGAVRLGEGTGRGESSVYIGFNAGANSANAKWNVAIGLDALKSNTSSEGHVAIGYKSAGNSTDGKDNISIGTYTLQNSEGPYNIAMGRFSGQNLDGEGNISMGWHSGNYVEGDWNILLGSTSGFKLKGTRNFGAVSRALYDAKCSDAIAIGYEALRFSNTNGVGAIGIGYHAGRNADGDHGVFIGSSTGTTNTGDNNVFIGQYAGSSTVYQSVANTLIIESSTAPTSNPLIYGEFDNDLVRINGDLEIENKLKISDVINLQPLSSDPTSAEIGDIYLHDSTGTGGVLELRCYTVAGWIGL